MSKKRLSILAVLALAIAVAGFAASTAPAARMASAVMSTIADNPSPTCPQGYWFNSSTGKCDVKPACAAGTAYNQTTNTCDTVATTATCATSTDSKGTTVTTCPVGVQASASDIDTGKVTVLGYIKANGLARSVIKKLSAQGECMWVGKGTKHPKFTNSGARNGSGAYGKFEDTRRTYVCHTGKGPSGWQKAYDINPQTGEKEHFCANYIWLGLVKGLIKGTVEVVRNLANVHMHLHAESHVTAVSPNCPGTSAEGSGQADIVLTLNEYMRTRGPVISSLSASAYGKATSSAHASVTCAPPVTTTNTVTTTTTNTTTTTQTVTTPSPSIRLEQIQEMYPNETRPICANLKNVPANARVVFSVQAGTAPKGSFADPSEPAPIGGSRVCDTFQAPNATGTNQYFAKLQVNGTDVDQDDLWVEIVPPPVNP